MGHVDEGGLQPLVQLDELGPGLDAQLGVQVGQGLVHQEDLGMADDGPSQGHALALAAGELLGLALEQLVDVQDAGGFLDPLIDLSFGGVAQLEAEGQVVVDGHVGVEGVVLEDHGDVAVFGQDVVDDGVVDVDVALLDLFQAGQQPQRGGFAAARRADEDHELLVGDVDVEVVDGQHFPEALAHIDVLYRCHAILLLKSTPTPDHTADSLLPVYEVL